MGPMWAPWTLLSGYTFALFGFLVEDEPWVTFSASVFFACLAVFQLAFWKNPHRFIINKQVAKGLNNTNGLVGIGDETNLREKTVPWHGFPAASTKNPFLQVSHFVMSLLEQISQFLSVSVQGTETQLAVVQLIRVTSYWVRWRLKSPASRLFI